MLARVVFWIELFDYLEITDWKIIKANLKLYD